MGEEATEKQSAKYRLALALAIELEGSIGKQGLSVTELERMEPWRLYRRLELEWWRNWNGLLQQWEGWQE